jgi:hypothetical protein
MRATGTCNERKLGHEGICTMAPVSTRRRGLGKLISTRNESSKTTPGVVMVSHRALRSGPNSLETGAFEVDKKSLGLLQSQAKALRKCEEGVRIRDANPGDMEGGCKIAPDKLLTTHFRYPSPYLL